MRTSVRIELAESRQHVQIALRNTNANLSEIATWHSTAAKSERGTRKRSYRVRSQKQRMLALSLALVEVAFQLLVHERNLHPRNLRGKLRRPPQQCESGMRECAPRLAATMTSAHGIRHHARDKSWRPPEKARSEAASNGEHSRSCAWCLSQCGSARASSSRTRGTERLPCWRTRAANPAQEQQTEMAR